MHTRSQGPPPDIPDPVLNMPPRREPEEDDDELPFREPSEVRDPEADPTVAALVAALQTLKQPSQPRETFKLPTFDGTTKGVRPAESFLDRVKVYMELHDVPPRKQILNLYYRKIATVRYKVQKVLTT